MKKRWLVLLLTFLLVFSLMPVSASMEEAEAWMSFYVSPTGSDDANGSKNAPFQTITRAQKEVRKYNGSMKGNIVVNLLPGRYALRERLEFETTDSGSNGYDVIWRGADPGNIPTISGGTEITGVWEEGEDGIWHVKTEGLKFARELFVNGLQATRAKSARKIYGNKVYKSGEIRTHRYYKNEAQDELGFYVDKSMLGLYENPEDIEFHWSQMWKSALYHVDNIIQDPENENQVIVLMDRRAWDEGQRAMLGSAEAHYSRGFVVENAYELLDQPGEFYYNKKTKVLSYMPREGEDMRTAEVICPQIDQLLYVHGVDYYNRIHNVRFENIKFAHATNIALEENSYAAGQGEYHYISALPFRIGHANNLVCWSEYVDFEACQFYGLSGIGLHFRDGAHHCEVVGNVFTEIGASGFAAGQYSQTKLTEPAKTNGPVDVAWGAAWSSSYQYNWFEYGFAALNTIRDVDSDLATRGFGWYSEPWAKAEGTYPWIRLELEDDYTLESFRFSFPKNATEEERSNFEVLISEDRDFKEYETLKVYTNPADFLEEIKIGDGKKWRYIMLRKTVPEAFCLNGVWAMSKDRGWLGQMGAPADCLIANNYFSRVGQIQWQTYGIWLNYVKRFRVYHNEIKDVPYSGMSIGWGWERADPRETSGDNEIFYNRIDRAMQHCNDGGGIYIFGGQWGSRVSYNYITNVDQLEGGIYNDGGSRGITNTDNVCVNTGRAYFLNLLSSDNTEYNTYSDTMNYEVVNGAENYSVEPVKQFVLSDPPDEVARIMADAGIEDDWLWIKSRIPQADTQRTILLGIDASEAYRVLSDVGFGSIPRATRDAEVANALLLNGDFGYLPWEFDPEAKEKVQYWLDALNNADSRTDDYTGGHIEEMHNLEFALKEAVDSVYHPSYEEMLEMCDELKASDAAKKSASALATFERSVMAVKASNPKTRGDKGVAAVQLEKAYKKLAQQAQQAEIMDFSVAGGATTIDVKNKTVTLVLSNGVDRTALHPSIVVSDGSKLAMELDDIDFTKDSMILPLYHMGLHQYCFWKLKIVSAMETATEANGTRLADAKAWTGGNVNVEFQSAGGAVTVSPWYQPSMNKTVFGGDYKFSLWAPRADTTNGIAVIFSAQTDEIEATARQVQDSYYMAELKGQNLTLYRVNSGEKTAYASAQNICFRYGEYNPFEISVISEGEVDKICIKLEGDTLIHALVDQPIGQIGHFGILTQYIPVKVK